MLCAQRLPRSLEIGADSAIARGDPFHEYDDRKSGYFRNFAIVDAEEFARDVANELDAENEVGESPLSKLLDEMAQAAIDNGSQGVKYGQRIEFDKRLCKP